jgi:hypothetical protein
MRLVIDRAYAETNSSSSVHTAAIARRSATPGRSRAGSMVSAM